MCIRDRRGTDAGSMAEVSYKIEKGYLYLGTVETGEIIELQLDDAPEFLYASPKIPDIQGLSLIHISARS